MLILLDPRIRLIPPGQDTCLAGVACASPRCGRERATPRPSVGGASEKSGAVVRTMARTPWREDRGAAARAATQLRSGLSELPGWYAVLLDLKVQGLVVGSEESRRCALVSPRGLQR